MRVGVLGGKGLLGKDVVRVLRSAGHEVSAPPASAVDITRFEQVERWVEEFSPQAVVNCAAFTDVDGCEKDSKRALMVNGAGVHNIISALNVAGEGALFVHISTDYVFDGKEGSYTETSSTNPVQVYGWTKLCGEAFALSYPRTVILRTSWLYGWGRTNFLKTVYEKLLAGEEVWVIHENRGNPTYTVTVAEGILKVLEVPRQGIYHLVDENEGGVTRYEEAVALAELMGRSEKVKKSNNFSGRRVADRPQNSSLKIEKWKSIYGSLPKWKESLRRFLRERR